MQLALPDEDGHHEPAGAGPVLEACAARGGALVLGPGLGRSAEAQAFAREVARRRRVSAAARRRRAERPRRRSSRASRPASAPTVLTPHAGELGRLLELDSRADRARRLHHAREAARRERGVVVLKGEDTIVARPDGLRRDQPRSHAGAGDGRYGRRPQRLTAARCSHAAATRSAARAPPCGCTRSPGRSPPRAWASTGSWPGMSRRIPFARRAVRRWRAAGSRLRGDEHNGRRHHGTRAGHGSGRTRASRRSCD